MSQQEKSQVPQSELAKMTKDVVTAYLQQNQISPEELPRLINLIHQALLKVAGNETTGEVMVNGSESPRPAVSIKKSVHEDYIVCLEDGKKLKMLKRHLRARYDMSPEAYREKWGLPSDYPMVAPAYARQRSSFAKSIGLGRGPKLRAGRPKKVVSE